MTRPFLALLLAGAMLAGCASYSVAPLSAPSDVLKTPDVSILSTDAQKIDRPYLTPQSIDLNQPLTPNALAVIAVIENPDLKAQRAKAGVTDAQAFAARLLPDPTFGANFDKILAGPDVFNAFGAQLGFDLNAIRTARVTRESGEAAKRQVRLDMAWAEWQTAGQARLLGVRILALTEQFSIAREGAASAERLFAAAQRAAGRGDIAAADLDTRRQSLIDATDKARTAERDLVAARGELNKTLGLPPEVELRLAPSADPAVPPDSAKLVAQALERRLDLQALRAGYGVAEADLHKAVLEQFPNLSLTIAGARDTANNYTLGPAVGFTLPLWNRNRGNIAIAKATREQLKAEYEARLFQTRAEIDTAVKGVMALRRQRAELTGQLPALQKYADATQRAAKRGDISPATAETALQAIRDRRLALLQIDQQIAEQTIALELLSGGPSEGWTR
ncbi:TolC family protein [Sphingomonas bacterium]|uniref:TolC family protein n=1 Tax=Sphingomonas bacterium TaxID=1895847 RepID=UPI0026280D95|nr:TolC family protein [Sphingomonas bacterium]MDB5679513.1 TolC family protein [Sphingomonas bacterium]